MSKHVIKRVKRDGKAVIKFQCPGCGGWGMIDDDQYHGRISIDCTNCKFHKTINIAADIKGETNGT